VSLTTISRYCQTHNLPIIAILIQSWDNSIVMLHTRQFMLCFCCISLFFLSAGVLADAMNLVEDLNIGSEGEGDGQFLWPWAIALSPNGTIYITDIFRCDIQAFTPNGTFITKWGQQGSLDGEFLYPQAIAVSPDGSIYVVDSGKAQHVQQFTSSGSFIRSFGESGSGPGEFSAPIGIAVNSTGYVYIADLMNNSIEIFTTDGQYQETWNTTNGMPPDFLYPMSIAIDQDDAVYIGLWQDAIYKFLPDKTLVQQWQLPNWKYDYHVTAVGPDKILYAIGIDHVMPGDSATIYRCAQDGTVEPMLTEGNFNFQGIGVDEQNRFFCTNSNRECVARLLQGTKTPGLPVPNLVWSKSLTEGSIMDRGVSNFMTTDGGFIETGAIWNGYWGDVLVLKKDNNGATEWMNSYGGSESDQGNKIIGTQDGNFILNGYTKSNDGNVTGNHGNGDYWGVMLNATGTLLWEKCYGGSLLDYGTDILETDDGNFILAGYTNSVDGNVTGNHGGRDIWVVKINREGAILWQKCYGGTADEGGNAIIKTYNGGYILTGYTESDDGDVSGNHGGRDIWVVETDSEGTILWQKCYGGTADEGGNAIIKTYNGGYLLTGYTESDNGDMSGNHGGTDLFLIETDNEGTILWQKCYGGTEEEDGSDIMAYNEKYILVGYTESSDDDVTGYHGNGDVWMIQTDTNGNIKWTTCFGGSSYDDGYSGISRGDGTYIITGETRSRDGDVSNPDVNRDLWTFMLDEMESDFSTSTQSGMAPLTVTFTGRTSSGMEPNSWSWYFGDGGISSEEEPVHQYTTPGTYTVSMQVSGPEFKNSVEKPGYIRVT